MRGHFRAQQRTHGILGLLLAAICVIVMSALYCQADEGEWQPQWTRVFLVSLTRFQSSHLHSFTTDDRLDDQLAQLFRDRGVPAQQIVLLKDDQATVQNIDHKFSDLLRNSSPQETLIFYFGSHGGYDHKTGVYSFYAFDGAYAFSRVFDLIERDFRGSRAFLLADSCYSGGIVELAKKRRTTVSYACLSSTFAHQTAWSGWRFVQCLMRGLSGSSVVDLDGNGFVELDELSSYSAHYMAFAAEGKPMFFVAGNFNSRLRLAATNGVKSSRIGDLLEVHTNNGWEKAEVIDTKDQRLKLHFTRDTRHAHDNWFAANNVRPFQFERFANGTVVDVKDASDEIWRSARVLESWESLHRCHRAGTSADYDEWFGPYRIRKSVAGSWSGHWTNNLDESGAETLELTQNHNEQITGTWSGNVSVKGERIGNDRIYFEGVTPGRIYRAGGRIEGSHLVLNYVAHRTDSSGQYHGWASLDRQGKIADAVRDPHANFSGHWTGAYENSRGATGSETLSLTEDSEKLRGVWSGVEVTGERIGESMFLLEGTSGNRHYRVIGSVTSGHLTLDYSATAGNDRYTGRSTLSR